MSRILIIGATSGMAKALAYEYAKQQRNLVLAGRDAEDLARIAGDLQVRFGVDVAVQPFEALDYDSHESFFEKCSAQGGLDGLILAYGYLSEQKEAQERFSEAQKAIEINFTSCVSILEIAARYFELKKKGFICVISSVAGDRGRQSNYMYGAAKGGLSIYLQGLRNRLFPSKVQVVTVKPGFVDTKMTFGIQGMFLVAKPEDVAKRVMAAIHKGKDTVYAPAFWSLIMLIIKMVPEKIFKRLKL